MKRTRLIVATTIALVLAACGTNNSDDSIPTLASVVPSTRATALPPQTTSTPTTVVTTTTAVASTAVPTETVGDPDLYLAEVTQLVTDFIFGISSPDEVPLPDVTNPDAAEALQSIFEFEWWTFTNKPSIDWADIYALSRSPARSASRNRGSQLSRLGSVYQFLEDPYEVHAAQVVPLEDSEVPVNVLNGFPDGSVIVEYESSIGRYEQVTPETGQVWETLPGWDRKARYVVMTPTASGWRVAWVGPL